MTDDDRELFKNNLVRFDTAVENFTDIEKYKCLDENNPQCSEAFKRLGLVSSEIEKFGKECISQLERAHRDNLRSKRKGGSGVSQLGLHDWVKSFF